MPNGSFRVAFLKDGSRPECRVEEAGQFICRLFLEELEVQPLLRIEWEGDDGSVERNNGGRRAGRLGRGNVASLELLHSSWWELNWLTARRRRTHGHDWLRRDLNLFERPCAPRRRWVARACLL